MYPSYSEMVDLYSVKDLVKNKKEFRIPITRKVKVLFEVPTIRSTNNKEIVFQIKDTVIDATRVFGYISILLKRSKIKI